MFNPVEKLLLKVETLMSSPLLIRLSPNSFISIWQPYNKPLRDSLNHLQSTRHVKLLITLTTFNRPQGCLNVINSLYESILHAAMQLDDIVLVVLNDKSDTDYSHVKNAATGLFNNSLIWLDSRHHLGKANFWCAHQTSLLLARDLKPERYLSLQDDIGFSRDMLIKINELWQLTHDDEKSRVLYLFSDNNDAYDVKGRWIKHNRENHSSGRLRKTQWFDLQAFYADHEFLKILQYWVMPIPASRWQNDSTLSSGVGSQFTTRCFDKTNIYQCYPSLITHGHEESLMNPEARAIRPFDNRQLIN